MPGFPRPTPQDPSPPEPWTVEEAQTVRGEVADQLVALLDTLDAIHGGLPEPPDIHDRQEGWKPYGRATDVLAADLLEEFLPQGPAAPSRRGRKRLRSLSSFYQVSILHDA